MDRCYGFLPMAVLSHAMLGFGAPRVQNCARLRWAIRPHVLPVVTPEASKFNCLLWVSCWWRLITAIAADSTCPFTGFYARKPQ